MTSLIVERCLEGKIFFACPAEWPVPAPFTPQYGGGILAWDEGGADWN
jgi:hypothetical protein